MASGLAGKVRRATESDEFDLANYDQSRCDELAKGAFSTPLPLANMVRLSFVVGGGKLVRQKYTDDLPKIFMGSLTAVGYADDSTASVEASSGGKFKYQHDTGKNLKFVHVFPQIDGGNTTQAGDAGDEEEEEEEKPLSPQDRLFRCEMDAFEHLTTEQLLTYSQKKSLLDRMKGRIAKLEEIEAKMTKLEQPSAEEQALFDDVGADELREKSKFVTGELQRMVEDGKLTSSEKATFLEDLEIKFETLDDAIKKAESEGKTKKVQMLNQQLELLQKTRAAAKDSGTASLPPLKHGTELRKLHGKIADLARLEREKKGNYSMDELKRLGEKPELEEAISVLEARSRGWFEDEAIFQERLQSCIRGAGRSAPKASAPKSSAASASGGGSGGYSTVSRGSRPAKAKAGAPSTRNAFAALG